MGWNKIGDLKGKLFENIEANSYVYFVHSFYVENSDQTIATCNEWLEVFSCYSI